jgi:hypothetical protein
VALITLARKISKIIYFILLFLVLGRALPRPEIYLDYDIARDICHFLFGSVNADTMYDTFFYITLMTVLSLSGVLYIATIKLFKIIRRGEFYSINIPQVIRLNISEKYVIYARLRLHVFLLKYHVVL